MLQQTLTFQAKKAYSIKKKKTEQREIIEDADTGEVISCTSHSPEKSIKPVEMESSEAVSPPDKTEPADTVAKRYRDLQELTVLRGHENWIWSLAFSPDGQILASGSRDNTVCLWDLSSINNQNDFDCLVDTPPDKKLIVLHGHKKPVFSVAYSADGKVLASGSLDKTVRLWEVQSGRELAVLRLYEYLAGEVLSVAFSSDGKTLASGSMDKTVRLWDTSAIASRSFLGRLIQRVSGKNHRILRSHDSPVLSVAFSPDGNTLASGSSDRTVRVWDTSTGQELFSLPGHKDWVSSVVYGPDGKIIASAGYDHTVRIWDTVSRSGIHVMRGHTSRVHSITFSPDGKLLASSSMDKTIRLWNVISGEELAVIDDHNDYVVPLAFSPEGNLLASGGYDKTIRIWQVLSRDNMFYKLGNSFSLQPQASTFRF